ncbi:hypothetical protein Patl1_07239 [Pistacia atlantica]|uniref:Uncharacterized protein n=1 Tax=Pistacia atlantica TaxID=434234 RepID=A0ACC1AHE4_9ROSI|nr:hypothetical protein Patl1_07239 [Pistacia atlantica]
MLCKEMNKNTKHIGHDCGSTSINTKILNLNVHKFL